MSVSFFFFITRVYSHPRGSAVLEWCLELSAHYTDNANILTLACIMFNMLTILVYCVSVLTFVN